ncbi:MAG: glycerophosphodiester phosphodiesterase family protein [Nannocystaceae bacterium]
MPDSRADGLDWLRARPIAHRGLHDCGQPDADVPENSLAAVEAAAAAGYPIELDVHLLADGQVAVFHDVDLERMTGVPGPITARARADLSHLRLRGGAHQIPTLAETLELVAGRVPVLIEVKTPRRGVGPLERATWRLLAGYRGAYAVQSFNPWAVAWFRVHAPHIPRGLVAYDFGDEPRLSALERLALRGLAHLPICAPHFIAYALASLPHPAPGRTRARGLPLLAWTVRSEPERARAATLADNVIFEGFAPDPDALR